MLKISFIVIFNKRKIDRLNGILINIDKMFLKTIPNSKYEIILAEQKEDEAFRSGQLRNLGFKMSSGNIIVFMDIDTRILQPVNIYDIIDNNKPILFWKWIVDVTDGDTINIKSAPKLCAGTGGLNIFTRSQFENSCGFSNLCIGWGCEDSLLYRRMQPKRLNYTIGHVYHARNRELWGVDKDANQHNKNIVNSDINRNKLFDSFKQTISNIDVISINNNIKHYIFSNISVPTNFKYHEEYETSLSFIKNGYK
jgi:predicted glycosyltransferase involved in capsule biosynthesis